MALPDVPNWRVEGNNLVEIYYPHRVLPITVVSEESADVPFVDLLPLGENEAVLRLPNGSFILQSRGDEVNPSSGHNLSVLT